MLNFLSSAQNDNTPKLDRWRIFFLLCAIMVLGVVAIGAGVERYTAIRWRSLTEEIGKKITAGEWKPQNSRPAVEVIPQPPRPRRISSAEPIRPESFSAARVFVRDNATGEMLFGKAAYEPWPIASITKLLSALTLLETPLDFSATTTASADAVYDNEIIPNQIYAVKDLWGAALVASSNRAIVSLVDASGLPRPAFGEALNRKILELGLTNTVIVEPTGLDPKNTASAADVARVLAEAMRNEKIKDMLSLSEYRIATADGRFAKTLKTTNWLLSGLIPAHGLKIEGGKTGSIPEADYNVAVQISSSTNRVIDIVILGAQTNDHRFAEARAAAEWVYRSYEWK